jgi:cytochrome P450
VLYLALPFVLSMSAIRNFKQHQALTMAKTRKRIEMGNIQNRQDFFGHILNGELSEEDLAANANVLIIAGAETTATALAAATALLLENPGCLARLRAEVLGSFRSSPDITGDAAARLPYLNAVLEEVLRYHPPLSHGFPRTSPGETVDGVYVPEGVMVSTDLNLVGRAPGNFEDPDDFRPERWIEDPSLRERMSGFAFSMGTYGCLGINMAYLEMRVVLAKLVFNFDWEFVDPNFDFVAGSNYYTLWTKPEMFVRYHPRTTGAAI